MSDLLLPEGTRLFHIGPPKTGSSAVQWALHESREELERHGVHYAWETRQAYEPAVALTEKAGQVGRTGPEAQAWSQLVAEVEASTAPRCIISSEYFAAARREHISRVAQDLGRDRVHVVRMLRRYDKQLPSYWQQVVSSGIHQIPLNEWLELILSGERTGFWKRQSYGVATQRWVDVFGPENVTTVVVNERDHDWLLRVTEGLVGLPSGLLVVPDGRENRSLNYAEAELLRHTCDLITERGWKSRVHPRYLRWGAIPAIRQQPADPEGGKVVLPQQFHERVAEVTRQHLADLDRLGVRVVGERDWLLEPTPEAPPLPEYPTVPVTTLVAAALGIIERSRKFKPWSVRDDGRPIERPTTPRAPGGTWQKQLMRRGTKSWAEWSAANPGRWRGDLKKRAAEALLEMNKATADWPDVDWDRYVRDGIVGQSLARPKVRGRTTDSDDPTRMDVRAGAEWLGDVISATDGSWDSP